MLLKLTNTHKALSLRFNACRSCYSDKLECAMTTAWQSALSALTTFAGMLGFPVQRRATFKTWRSLLIFPVSQESQELP